MGMLEPACTDTQEILAAKIKESRLTPQLERKNKPDEEKQGLFCIVIQNKKCAESFEERSRSDFVS